jgi:hypothetical protein
MKNEERCLKSLKISVICVPASQKNNLNLFEILKNQCYLCAYLRQNNSSFFILHSSLNFASQNSVGRAASPPSVARVGLSAPSRARRCAPEVRVASWRVVPLLSLSHTRPARRAFGTCAWGTKKLI